jgi:hypothetical protein
VEELTDRPVAFFVGRKLLEPGPFRLGLVRDGEIVDLDPEDRLREGVVDGDVLSTRGVTARSDGHYVHIRAHEVGEEGILVLDAEKYDDEPVGVFVAENAVRLLPGSEWPPGLCQDKHPVLHRPFARVRGTIDYHIHPSHIEDGWDRYRGRIRLTGLVVPAEDHLVSVIIPNSVLRDAGRDMECAGADRAEATALFVAGLAYRGQCHHGTGVASRKCQQGTGTTVSTMNRVRTPLIGQLCWQNCWQDSSRLASRQPQAF